MATGMLKVIVEDAPQDAAHYARLEADIVDPTVSRFLSGFGDTPGR